MTEDVIRIDGVEYEQGCIGILDPGSKLIAIHPKRKQTGWICRCNVRSLCCTVTGRDIEVPVDICLDADWQPFYGKVVE